MLQFLKKKQKASTRIGITMNADQIAIAHMGEKNGAPYLLHCERFPSKSPEDSRIRLAEFVRQHGLEGTQVSAVMNPSDYSLQLVEAPNVEPEELRSAVRWKVKDLIDIKLDEAGIDVFELPEDAFRGRKMVYVVAAKKSRLQQIIERINECDLEVAIIDIPELAMKNISSLYVDDSQGAAFIDLRRTGSTINITINGDLYLTRRINTQLETDVLDSPEWPDLKERLVVEIQRSLDYYESQVGKNRVNTIYMAHRQRNSEGMLASLNEMLDGQISILDLSKHLNSAVELSPETQQICMSAIGGTLRGMKKASPEQPQPGTDDSSTDSSANAQEAA